MEWPAHLPLVGGEGVSLVKCHIYNVGELKLTRKIG